MDLFSFERSSEVFMRGIRALPRNLSGKRWNPLCSTRWEFNWASPFPSSSEKPIHLARCRFLELEHRCETAQLPRDAAQLGRTFGGLGRSTPLAGVFRHVLEADLLDRPSIRSHGC